MLLDDCVDADTDDGAGNGLVADPLVVAEG
jgi:hypothetical protein